MRHDQLLHERDREATGQPISLSEILSALSFALDLTEGAVPGHALRCCLLGMRLADEAQISAEDRCSLYYALLLKDIGCSSNAARICQIIGGDDRALKAGIKRVDWTRTNRPSPSMLRFLWQQVLPGAGVGGKIVRIGQMALSQEKDNREMITLRCDRGAQIVRKLGMSIATAEAVRSLDEHWDGSGYPEHRKKGQISRLSQMCAVAQHLDVFATEHGPEKAMDVLSERSGHWFNPDLVRLAKAAHARGSLWRLCTGETDVEDLRRAAVELAPWSGKMLAPGEIDTICEAFADVVDAKSPFTYRHSIGVADAAVLIAKEMGFSGGRLDLVRRAALLHDVGKLSVSNLILDKPGKLSAEEWASVREHPGQTREILGRISAFRELATIAGEHHEKLDGSGYPDRRLGRELCLESRIIAVADIYGALAEARSYRPGLDLDQIVAIMKKDVPEKLDEDCFESLLRGIAKRCADRGATEVALAAAS